MHGKYKTHHMRHDRKWALHSVVAGCKQNLGPDMMDIKKFIYNHQIDFQPHKKWTGDVSKSQIVK